MKNIVLKYDLHKDASVIKVKFLYDKELIDLVKTIPDTRWSRRLKSWYVPASQNAVQTVFNTL
jgi:hypothetical protein